MLFGVVHRAAGMTGRACTALVMILVVLVLCSHHVVFAMHGVPTKDGWQSGWEACTPSLFLVVHGFPLMVAGVCAALCHEGDSPVDTVADLLKTWL